MAGSKLQASFKLPIPSKRVLIEILGGDADGLYLETASQDLAIAKEALMMYQLTHGGKVGCSRTGMSVANVIRLLHGEKLSDFQQGGQPHYYTVVERLEDNNQLFLRVQYTAGRTRPSKKQDGSLPQLGWVNTAIRKFVMSEFEGLNKNWMVEFWIGEDVRNGEATAVERTIIEQNYREGSLESKCETIVANLMAHQKVNAIYSISDDVIYFRPSPR